MKRGTLPELLASAARKVPKRAAVVYFGNKISYQQLIEQVRRCAAGLQALGVRRGDRVALMTQNCPQFVVAYFGVLRAGAIVTPTSPIYTAREAGHQWHDAGARVVIAETALLPMVEKARPNCPQLEQVVTVDPDDYLPTRYPAFLRALRAGRGPSDAPSTWQELLKFGNRPRPVATRPGDLACLQYTGGTTGTSKGAMLTHANLVINACQANHWARAGEDGPETSMAALPLFHIFAQTCVMLCSVATTGTIVILPRFELKSALQAVRRYRPTFFHGVPTMFLAMTDAPNARHSRLRSLRMCLSGGAALPVEVAHRFESVTGAKLVEGYGLTEASPVTHVNPLDGSARKGSIGKVIACTQARIMDVETGRRELPDGEPGEIVIKGPQVMKGYWQKPEETARVLRRGWLYTGDIAKRDADGFFYIVDRKKDLIIAGGFNIYPREVEEVLFEHPRIQEAVVVGVPDPYRGETVKAFVVVKPGPAPSSEEIVCFCRERLAAYKVPRQIEFRESLPKSGVGKYLRRQLRAEAIAAAAANSLSPQRGEGRGEG
ncbi:MAG TPA: long-chain fatty acid--CoA ligase [Verrucomicrobiae bacterium]|nr:long-chain fatty acid--CoA ligase [Verrucomicrobiae bacterium]